MRFRGGSIGVVLALTIAAYAFAQSPEPCPQPFSTWDLMQRGIFDRHGCAVSYCHGDAKLLGMDLRPEAAYDNIVNVRSTLSPDRYLRVAPGDPNRSHLWLTMAKRTLEMTTVPGEAMPIGRPRVSREELEAMRLWILAGAPATGFVPGVSDLMDLCPTRIEDDYGYVPACELNERGLLLPDLVTETPSQIRHMYRNGRRVVEFTTTVANLGDGPLVIQATFPPKGREPVGASQIILKADGKRCAVPAGELVHYDTANYWAVPDIVDFELRKDDPHTGKLVARSAKRAFCFLDTDPVRGTGGQPPQQFTGHCTDATARMGISKNYKDTYHRSRPEQWIDLDDGIDGPVEPGTYYLVNVADPRNRLWEVDGSRRNNTGYTRVTVVEPIGGGAPRRFTPTPTPTVAPASPGQVQRPPRPTRTPRGMPGIAPPRPALPPRVAPPPPERPMRPTRTPVPTRTPRGMSGIAPPQPTLPPRVAPPSPERPMRPTRAPVPTRTPRGLPAIAESRPQRPPRPTRTSISTRTSPPTRTPRA